MKTPQKKPTGNPLKGLAKEYDRRMKLNYKPKKSSVPTAEYNGKKYKATKDGVKVLNGKKWEKLTFAVRPEKLTKEQQNILRDAVIKSGVKPVKFSDTDAAKYAKNYPSKPTGKAWKPDKAYGMLSRVENLAFQIRSLALVGMEYLTEEKEMDRIINKIIDLHEQIDDEVTTTWH